MSFVQAADTGISAINNVLVQEANRINEDIYRRTVHTSPWIDLMKQTAFRDGQGYQQTTLVYDRAIPTTGTNGNTAGVLWHDIALVEPAFGGAGANAVNAFNTSLPDVNASPRRNNLLAGATKDIAGQSGGDTDGNGTYEDARSYINFSRQLKQYTLKRAIVESPRISLEDLRFAAYRQEQIRAIMDLMTEAVRYTWENRYRDEFERVADNLVLAKTASSSFVTGQEGLLATAYDVDASTDGADINANISNALLDKIYNQMVRKGAASEAYGRENGRPVFALVCSSNASRSLQIESEYRDDVRYNNAKVSELIAPLGVEKSFRGFYHLIDDLAPRYTFNGTTDLLERVLPYTIGDGTGGTVAGVTIVNSAYEDAPFEAAFVIHPHVCESQIPNPFSGAGAIKFNPVNYRGQFKWTNIPDAIRNPDGTVGFFRGVLASATRPIKTDFGYTILFQRTATTNAVV
jgi:hypothetical protein